MSRRWSTKGGRSYPSRAGSPPPQEFFDAVRPNAGDERFSLTFGDLRMELNALDATFAAALRSRYGPYADEDEPRVDAALAIRLVREDREYFIEPAGHPEFNPIWLACDGTRVRYAGHRVAGWFDTASREGQVLLARGTFEPELPAIENFLRCAVAWVAAERGGALVHGASAVRGGKGYLFFGESGAGKSTLAAATSRARIVSDDLSLVLPNSSGGPDLVGSPFRATDAGGLPVVGRFPLAAAFRIVKDVVVEVRPASRAIVLGQLVGNLPFVAEALGARPDLFATIERAFASVPLMHLHFRKDDSYWDAIDGAGL